AERRLLHRGRDGLRRRGEQEGADGTIPEELLRRRGVDGLGRRLHRRATVAPRATEARMASLADETRWMGGVDQAALAANGEGTPAELLEAAIERMEATDPAVHALTITWFDHARRLAADPALPGGPFRGVPFLLKDLYTSFAGQTLSNGNKALKEA